MFSAGMTVGLVTQVFPVYGELQAGRSGPRRLARFLLAPTATPTVWHLCVVSLSSPTLPPSPRSSMCVTGDKIILKQTKIGYRDQDFHNGHSKRKRQEKR